MTSLDQTWGHGNPNPGWERWCAVGGEEEVCDLVNDPYELNNPTRVAPGHAGPLLGQLRPLLGAVKGCVVGGCP
jgi:hypothetical protein